MQKAFGSIKWAILRREQPLCLDQKEMFDMSMEREIREGMRFFRTSIPSGYAAIQRSEDC